MPNDLVFGRVPDPGIEQRHCPKPSPGAGYTPLAKRRQPVGVCGHITAGLGSLDFYARFFSTGGERQYDALVDYVIDRNGDALQLNDPYGYRSPWANGGSDGLEGDGPLFVRTFGIGAINDRLVSMERVGVNAQPMTPPQLETDARISAKIFDTAKVPWHTFPLHPAGAVTDDLHYEFATKPCPEDGMIAQVDQRQDRTRAILRAYQTGASTDESVPPPAPIAPDHGKYPAGMDAALAAAAFGVGVLHYADGRTGHFAFHEGRAVCEAWLARARKEKTYPRVLARWQFADSPAILRELVEWVNGWRLWQPNERAGWRWM